MNKQVFKTDNYEKALLIIRGVAIIRLISIVIAFLFWFSVTTLVLLLNLFGIFPFDILRQLLEINQVLSIIGLSPLLLTILSWRLIEKLCSFYIQKYTIKHIKLKQ